MAEIQSLAGPLPSVPDNLTLAQFILDSQHPTRPIRPIDSPWIIDDRTGQRIGLEELRTRTYGLANAFCFRYGIKEDDVVLLFSPNHVDYLVAVWAAHRLGAAMSGANPLFSAGELEYQIKETRASILITHPDSLEIALEAARASNIPDENVVAFDVKTARERLGPSKCTTVQDLINQGLETPPSFVERTLNAGEGRTKIAFYNFSSGTTGKPKAVAIPHIAPIANVLQLAAHNKVNQNYCPWEEQRFRPGDICNGALPLYHIYGLVFNSHFIFFCGMTFILTAKFNFIEFLKNIVTHRMTHLLLVPPQIVLLCKHPAVKDYDFSHVRYITSGAAPLSRELMERLVEIFPNAALGQSYGTTETCTVVTSLPIEKKQDLSGSAGTLLPGITARVVKPDGSLADFGEPGELVVKTPSIALGYSNNEKSTKETFIDGWMRTGDEVKIDRNAEIFVLDRLKEMLKVRGFQVAPAELEGCLLDHPDVADTCVVGITDDYSGELPLAFVVLRPEAGKRAENSASAANEIKQSIIKHVADNKVAYKRLAGGVEFVDIIPKNPSGKLLRRVLRDKARGMRATAKAKL